MPDLFAPTLAEQIAEVHREVVLREHVYRRRVEQRTISRKEADRRIETMRAVLNTLLRLQEQREAVAPGVSREVDFGAPVGREILPPYETPAPTSREEKNDA